MAGPFFVRCPGRPLRKRRGGETMPLSLPLPRSPMKHDLPPFAVLIDADNVRLDTITPILEEITRHARITVRRIYGDFTRQNLSAWKAKLAEEANVAQLQGID